MTGWDSSFGLVLFNAVFFGRTATKTVLNPFRVLQNEYYKGGYHLLPSQYSLYSSLLILLSLLLFFLFTIHIMSPRIVLITGRIALTTHYTIELT